MELPDPTIITFIFPATPLRAAWRHVTAMAMKKLAMASLAFLVFGLLLCSACKPPESLCIRVTANHLLEKYLRDQLLDRIDADPVLDNACADKIAFLRASANVFAKYSKRNEAFDTASLGLKQLAELLGTACAAKDAAPVVRFFVQDWPRIDSANEQALKMACMVDESGNAEQLLRSEAKTVLREVYSQYTADPAKFAAMIVGEVANGCEIRKPASNQELLVDCYVAGITPSFPVTLRFHREPPMFDLLDSVYSFENMESTVQNRIEIADPVLLARTFLRVDEQACRLSTSDGYTLVVCQPDAFPTLEFKFRYQKRDLLSGPKYDLLGVTIAPR